MRAFEGIGVADILGTRILVIAVEVIQPHRARLATHWKQWVGTVAAFSRNAPIDIARNIIIAVLIDVAASLVRLAEEARHEGGVACITRARVVIVTIRIGLAAVWHLLHLTFVRCKITRGHCARIAVIARGIDGF